jgi:hypothetical protein
MPVTQKRGFDGTRSNLLAIIAIGGALLVWSVITPRLERWNTSGSR